MARVGRQQGPRERPFCLGIVGNYFSGSPVGRM